MRLFPSERERQKSDRRTVLFFFKVTAIVMFAFIAVVAVHYNSRSISPMRLPANPPQRDSIQRRTPRNAATARPSKQPEPMLNADRNTNIAATISEAMPQGRKATR